MNDLKYMSGREECITGGTSFDLARKGATQAAPIEILLTRWAQCGSPRVEQGKEAFANKPFGIAAHLLFPEAVPHVKNVNPKVAI